MNLLKSYLNPNKMSSIKHIMTSVCLLTGEFLPHDGLAVRQVDPRP